MKRSDTSLDPSEHESSAKKSRILTQVSTEHPDLESIHHPPAKAQRKRKRGLYKTIVQQMEFYFGDANLTKSRFMQEALAQDPWLDLEVFLKFNKLVSMLDQSFARIDLEDLWTALSKIQSDLLEIREQTDGKRQIRRKLPLKVKENEDECTIYVENIPPNVSNDCLRKLFTQYDQVSYVSLPKFKNHEGNKGFAFVEFDTPEGVQKALEAFGAEEGVITSEKPPEELQSVKAFIRDEAGDTQESQQELNEKDSKEPKEPNEETQGQTKEKKSKKKNRKRKREEAPEQDDVELKMMSLRIMSKREWKRLRNKYLNQQRENFKWAKKQMNKPTVNTHIKFQEDTGKPRVDENGKPSIESSVTTDIEESQPESQFRLIPGTVVKFTVDTPIEDRTQVKRQVKSAFIDGVEYVDVQIGASEYHVRCHSAELAAKLAAVSCLGQGCVLEGQDEETYWAKMERERAEKRSGKIPKQTIRGRKKVLKKLDVAANSHKYFTDD
ncbi:hypothetical protein TCAL_05696 [Tigriopus californicus]|uniref:Uncharacterized protein n=1 Tax=Tigriopus californicus TaxID=6832 RepID=A0A553N804_TIGCA|nr:la-related protein 7-like [Tigriopus californicus]TRY61566.1 hypothetical protein TCAL_05696 [Tigriopus californicus]|eukprot:TCALIF_05696-PA protein Name:"Similar to larp7 La-related protein 7 (Danio rerio)" AED:0.05 eAED:0.05 QI:0/-1/0/1/-1/1/1/0/495